MRSAVIAITGSALAACAAPVAPPASTAAAPSCFRSADIRGHTFEGDSTMYLRVGRNGVYRLGMRGGCLAGSMAGDPIITRQPPGSAMICRPIDLDIAIGRQAAGYSVPCIVDSITLLTPAQVEALPPRLRP